MRKKNLMDDLAILGTQVAQASQVLLDAHSTPDALQLAVTSMLAVYARITARGDRSDMTEETVASPLPDGSAISPQDAARCLLDHYRTAQFVRGMHAAIGAAQQRFPGRTIEILYAGCGPYASLVLPLCTCFTPGQIRFTLLDFHQHSLDSAKLLLENLGYDDFVRAYIQADAASYRYPEHLPLHIVLTETMQKALDKEPQFAITANLAPQLEKGGILVPECIAIDFCLADLAREFAPATVPSLQRVRTGQQRLLTLAATGVAALAQQARLVQATGERLLPGVKVQIPELAQDTRHAAMLLTRITVFGAIGLDDYESGLTYPCVLHDLGALHSGQHIEFRYRLGCRPGFVYQLAEDANSS